LISGVGIGIHGRGFLCPGWLPGSGKFAAGKRSALVATGKLPGRVEDYKLGIQSSGFQIYISSPGAVSHQEMKTESIAYDRLGLTLTVAIKALWKLIYNVS